MATKTVGKFTYDEATGEVSGPADYMRDRYAERIARIQAGQDVIVNSGYSPDILTAILVSLQTDYAAYRGEQQMLSWTERR